MPDGQAPNLKQNYAAALAQPPAAPAMPPPPPPPGAPASAPAAAGAEGGDWKSKALEMVKQYGPAALGVGGGLMLAKYMRDTAGHAENAPKAGMFSDPMNIAMASLLAGGGALGAGALKNYMGSQNTQSPAPPPSPYSAAELQEFYQKEAAQKAALASPPLPPPAPQMVPGYPAPGTSYNRP